MASGPASTSALSRAASGSAKERFMSGWEDAGGCIERLALTDGGGAGSVVKLNALPGAPPASAAAHPDIGGVERRRLRRISSACAARARHSSPQITEQYFS